MFTLLNNVAVMALFQSYVSKFVSLFCQLIRISRAKTLLTHNTPSQCSGDNHLWGRRNTNSSDITPWRPLSQWVSTDNKKLARENNLI